MFKLNLHEGKKGLSTDWTCCSFSHLHIRRMVDRPAASKGGLGSGLTLRTEHRVHVETYLHVSPLRTSSLACLLFTAEENAVPPEQTVQLRVKNSHLVPLSLWQCLD